MGNALPQSKITVPTCKPDKVIAECQQYTGHDDLIDRKYIDVQLLAGARDGDLAIVSEALNKGASVETRQPMRILTGSVQLENPSTFGPTPLMLAAKSGSLPIVRLLLDKRAKVHAKDEDGLRPTHWAALSGELSSLQVLIEAGADVSILDDDCRHVLDHLPEEITRDRLELRRWQEVTGPRSAEAPAPKAKAEAQPAADGLDFMGQRLGR